MGLSYVVHPLIREGTVEDRLYQRNIVNVATKENTLVILPTALGKTVIAALVAVEVLLNNKSKKILMMAPTRPLVLQHEETFRKIINLPENHFIAITGKTTREKRTKLWNSSSKFYFATPQIVKNDVATGILNLKDFALLIFDESHRAVKDYAYTEVAKQYTKQCDYPLILALTASPGSSQERIKMVCDSLLIERIEYKTEEDPDVKPYINPISIEVKQVSLPAEYQLISALIKGMLSEKLKWLKENNFLKVAVSRATKKDLIELGEELRKLLASNSNLGVIYQALAYQSAALTLFHMLEILETQGMYTLRPFLIRVESDDKKSHNLIMKDARYAEVVKLVFSDPPIEHPKVELLKKVIEEQLMKNKNSRILIFTQYRDTVTHLVEVLKKIDGVRVERFVGQASKAGDEGLSQEKQVEIIEDFRKGNLNVLISTSVGEEGLDIPEVDLVVFYEPIPSEIRYIQRRGRTGRKSPGKVVVLSTSGTADVAYFFSSYKKVKKMKKIIEQLNLTLQRSKRSKLSYFIDKMTQEDILALQNSNSKQEEVKESIEETEIEDEKANKKQLSTAKKLVYREVLRSGASGISIDKIKDKLEEEGMSKEVVEKVVKSLNKSGILKRYDDVVKVPYKNIPNAKLFSIEVEKVLEGHAIVIVNDKWYAKLYAEDYEGPRYLIKKGSSFKALGELYRSNNSLCVKVRHVVQENNN
ncbi:MAG: helicase-related protein [Thermoproteota archaeon]|jgi:Fanconi anemia group M protein